MTNGNDSAFPEVDTTHLFSGLTKREYFATAAMQGLLADSAIECVETDKFSRLAVEHADALIAALNQENK